MNPGLADRAVGALAASSTAMLALTALIPALHATTFPSPSATRQSYRPEGMRDRTNHQ